MPICLQLHLDVIDVVLAHINADDIARVFKRSEYCCSAADEGIQNMTVNRTSDFNAPSHKFGGESRIVVSPTGAFDWDVPHIFFDQLRAIERIEAACREHEYEFVLTIWPVASGWLDKRITPIPDN